MAILTYDEKQFYLDGKPYRIISGAMHYFRIPREYWRDRLMKLKECGFNTLETYTCWNLHEPEEGRFDFTGMLDLAAYIDLAAELGLNVILRPGPYICSEWDFGGLPAWLLKYDKMTGLYWWWLEYNAYGTKLEGWYNAPLFDSTTGKAGLALKTLCRFADPNAGILEVGADNAAMWYDLSGYPVSNPRQQGIYIRNGRKVMHLGK